MTTEKLINQLIEEIESPFTPHSAVTRVVNVLEFLRDEPYELMGLTEEGISEVIRGLIE